MKLTKRLFDISRIVISYKSNLKHRRGEQTAMTKKITYSDAGVNIELGDDVSKILYNAAKQTWENRKGKLGELIVPFDDFSGVRAIDVSNLPEGTLMNINFDGVGTKMELAERINDHSTIAFDLFAMVCDDAVLRGAEPVLIGSILDVNSLGSDEEVYLDEIRQLVDTIYEQQEQKREDDIAFLQAQIKPHFLYNTFDTIHWMARKQNADNIVQMISALTKLYRIGLSKGRDMITLEEEIEHVRNYLIIQRTRYSDILEYEIECTADSKRLYVLKLMLQPLVENAIYHGIKQRTQPGKIRIKAFEESGALWLRVSDNGPGISPEKLETLRLQIKSANNDTSGYGLYNVNKRITLLHGDEFGIHIESIVGEGTTVTIKHPSIYERGSEIDV